MPGFAQGLMLTVLDRDEFESFIKENAHDPGVHYDSWGENAIPTALYIVSYQDDDEDPYYQCLDEHVNGVVNNHYYGEDILQKLIDAGIVEKDGYDVDFVETNV